MSTSHHVNGQDKYVDDHDHDDGDDDPRYLAARKAGVAIIEQYADAYYHKVMPAGAKKRIEEHMERIDDKGTGRIKLAKLLPFFPTNSHKSIRLLFDYLDVDGAGTLSFEGCITLYYLHKVGYRSCKNCHDPILNNGLTCKTCWERSRGSEDTYDLCLECYIDNNPHERHRNDFVDQHILQNQTSHIGTIKLSMIQCIKCGDFHNKNTSSNLKKGSKHVNDDLVCEWCYSWSCTSCGKFFEASPANARAKMFLTTNYFCQTCRVPGNLTDLTPVIKSITKNKRLQEQCSTCAFKIRSKELFYVGNQIQNPAFAPLPEYTYNPSSSGIPFKDPSGAIDTGLEIAQCLLQ